MRYSVTIISVQRYKKLLNYANYSGIIPHIFANCLFSFAFLLFPSLTCLSFFSSSLFLSFYLYLRSFRPNYIRASALLSRHISTKLGRSPVSLFLRSFRPNYIRASALLSRHISTKFGRSPVSPFLLSFRPNCIQASALLSRHISTKLGRSPVSPFLLSFRPNDIRLHRHRSKTAFFLPLS